jgi:hypothetical protein
MIAFHFNTGSNPFFQKSYNNEDERNVDFNSFKKQSEEKYLKHKKNKELRLNTFTFKLGTILYSFCNFQVKFYIVIEITGKRSVIIQEIGQHSIKINNSESLVLYNSDVFTKNNYVLHKLTPNPDIKLEVHRKHLVNIDHVQIGHKMYAYKWNEEPLILITKISNTK